MTAKREMVISSKRAGAKYLIVNADDFGLSAGINRGIIAAHQGGILSSATLMANMPATAEAAQLARANPTLGVGVHLNFLRGIPLCPAAQVKSLLNQQGRFVQDAGALLFRVFTKKFKAAELEKELTAQVQKVIDLGIEPTHFDSEKNMHLLPGVVEVVINVARKFGVAAIRYTDEANLRGYLGLPNNWLNSQFCKMRFLAYTASRARGKIENADLRITDYFWGVTNSGQMDERAYSWILPRLPAGVTEIMTHPGFIDAQLAQISQTMGKFYINRYREIEYYGLMAPSLKEIMEKQAIKLINYRDLVGLTEEKQ